jgi:hypothetical protein
MAFGMAGCSDSGSSDSDNESSAAAVQTESSAADSSEDATATTTTTTTAPAVTDSSQAEVADTSTADENKPASGDSNDIAASAIEPSETSEENLAPIGQWIKTTRYCATDKIYHTIYTRITKVVSKSEDADYVNKAIELNNSVGSDFSKIDESELKIPDDCELCVMEYEVYVPEDFPSDDWGIISPDVNYSASNKGGGGIPSADGASTYIGMGGTTELLTQKKNEYFVGNTYKYVNLFLMVKGYKDYKFTFSSYPEGTTSDSSDDAVTAYISAE